jgi:hypothetical protein
MTDDPKQLRPADPDDLRRALAFALTFDGRKRFREAEELAARITAEHLARYLERSGFVIMKREPGFRGGFAGIAKGSGS